MFQIQSDLLFMLMYASAYPCSNKEGPSLGSDV